MAKNNEYSAPEPVKAAVDTAHHLEAAAASGNTTEYNNVMSEVNNYRDTHRSQSTSMYMSTITEQLERDHTLPEVALFDTKTHFGDIDKNGDGFLKAGEIGQWRGRKDANELQQNFAQFVSEKYDDIKRTDRIWGLTEAITRPSLDSALDSSKTSASIAHLFEKNSDGVSLYERLKDSDGNIPNGKLATLQDVNDANGKTLGLTEQDKQTIAYLQTWAGRSGTSYLPFTADQTKEHLQQLCKENGVEMPNQ